MYITNVFDTATALRASCEHPEEVPAVGEWINGRIVGVLGSPELSSAEHIAFGMSALPANGSTPQHDHLAEELALVVTGAGFIDIGGEEIPVRAGDLVRTPSWAPHVTRSSTDEAMVVLWLYAPAGSEKRWLRPDPKENH